MIYIFTPRCKKNNLLNDTVWCMEGIWCFFLSFVRLFYSECPTLYCKIFFGGVHYAAVLTGVLSSFHYAVYLAIFFFLHKTSVLTHVKMLFYLGYWNLTHTNTHTHSQSEQKHFLYSDLWVDKMRTPSQDYFITVFFSSWLFPWLNWQFLKSWLRDAKAVPAMMEKK